MKLLTTVAVSLLAVSASSMDSQCLEGAVLNHEGICVSPKFIEGCYQYASNNHCHKCSFQYTLQTDGKCSYQTQKASKSCCKSHDPLTGLCKQCESGLIQKDGECQELRILGCINQDYSTGKCKSCAKGFYLENGDCSIGVEHCEDYMDIGSDKKICDRCDHGHSLVNNACLPNSILGCKDQVGEVCLDCFDPFIEKENHCEVANCKSHNEFGCIACDCGFYLNNERKCKEIGSGCLRYNRGICTDCMQHFKLKGNVCEIEGCLEIDGFRCIKCAEGYKSTELGCKMDNCMVWNNELCEVCDMGFRQKEGKCVESYSSHLAVRSVSHVIEN